MDDLISRQAAIDSLANMYRAAEKWGQEADDDVIKARAESCMASLVEMKLRIEKLPSAQRWIPVTERLHVGGDKSGAVCEDIWMLFDDGSVFCGWMNGCTETAYYLDGYNDFVRKCPISRVRAWKPKPEPPKEET